MIYFVNPYQNTNVGDVAIFYASSWFFLYNKLPYTIITPQNYHTVAFTPNDIVAICGGGWMGIYDDALIEFFYNMIDQGCKQSAKVILFPCSFYPKFDTFKRISDNHCIIYARDHESKKLLIDYFPNANVKFCHDMAFMLPKLNERQSIKDLSPNNIGIYDRNDTESKSTIKELLSLGTLEHRPNRFIEMDYDLSNAWSYITETLFHMKKYRLLVTDTLHISIFSYLLNIPCLILDNYYGKLTNTWSSYNTTVIQTYDTNKSLDTSKYDFTGSNDIRFNYYNLLSEFQ